MADIADRAAKLLQKNFPKFGKFRRSCTYKSMNSSDYDPATRVITEDVAGTQTGAMFIFDSAMKFAESFGDNVEVKENDRVAIIPTLDLDFIPGENDQLIDPDSIQWTVKSIGQDPGPIHWQLLIRPRK